MPIFRVYFERRFDMTVEAPSREAVYAAIDRAVEDSWEIDNHWGDIGKWEGRVYGQHERRPDDPDPDQCLRGGKFVAYEDRDQASEDAEGGN